jgi:putative transposase
MNEIQKTGMCGLLCSESYSDIDQISKVLKADMGEYLKRKVFEISKFQPEIEIIEVNTDLDHIHLLVSIPPKFSVSKVVRMIKAHTDTYIRKKFLF